MAIPLIDPSPTSLAVPLREAWDRLARRYGLAWSETATERDRLGRIGRVFARLPYENLSKIIETLDRPGLPRGPHELIEDHLRWGTGGTCFSLTVCWLSVLRLLGWRAEPILADRAYGADTHCALLVWVEGQPHLLDPGYLLTDPLPLQHKPCMVIPTGLQEVILQQRGGDRLDLSTRYRGQTKYRLTYKTTPVERDHFERCWQASYGWEMMRYPVLTQSDGQVQLYVQKRHLLVRQAQGAQRVEWAAAELGIQIAKTFQIDERLVERALAHLRRQGERLG